MNIFRNFEFLLVSIAGGVLVSCAPANGTTWYVDFINGNDDANGRTEGTAWKHAPGDPNASGRPARHTLASGDRVVFRAGIPYRGTIRVQSSGAAGKPIVFTGHGWGEGLAIIDGSDPVRSIRPCSSSSDCGNALNWMSLSIIEHDRTDERVPAIFGSQGIYWMSRVPSEIDPFFMDEIDNYLTISLSQLEHLRSGIIADANLSKIVETGGDWDLSIWVKPNIVVRRPVLGTSKSEILFDPSGLQFYTDRETKVALVGGATAISEPGFFAIAAPGTLLAWLRPNDEQSELSVGSGRTGFDLNGQSNIVISGFHFRNYSGSRGQRTNGRAISNQKSGGENIEISGNLFGPASLDNGSAIVVIQAISNLEFKANRIENIAFGGGFRAAGLSPSNISVIGNVISRVGRTGISVLGVNGAVIEGNILYNIKGIHGNGITAYLGNFDIEIRNNCVFESRRPLTFHGDRIGDTRVDISISNNIFISSENGQAAINSWGAKTNGVAIRQNILIGRRHGLLMSSSDRNVLIHNNFTSGVVLPRDIPSDWIVRDNTTSLSRLDARNAVLTEAGCSVPSVSSITTERTTFEPRTSK